MAKAFRKLSFSVVLAGFCTMFISLHVVAQQSEKFEKNYRKYYEFLRKGDVFEANEEFQRLRKRFDSKNAIPEDTLKIIYAEALLYQLKGDNNYATDLTDSYISKAKQRFGESHPVYIEALYNKAHLHYLIDDYYPASMFCNRAIQNLSKAGVTDSNLIFKIRLLHASLLVDRGYLNEAIPEVRYALHQSDNRLLERKEVITGSGKKKFKKYDLREMHDRMAEKGAAMLLHAKLYSLLGDYINAEITLKETGDYIKKKLTEKDATYIDYLLQLSEYEQMMNREQESLNALKKAKSLANKRYFEYTYLQSHPRYLGLLECMIQAYQLKGKKDKVIELDTEYRKIILTYYPTVESYKVRMRIPFNKSWERNETSFMFLLEKLVTDIEAYKLPNKFAFQILGSLYQTTVYADSINKANYYLNYWLTMLKDVCGEGSINYHLVKCEQAHFYAIHADKIPLAADIYKTSFDGVVKQNLLPGHNQYMRIQNQFGEYYEALDKFSAALGAYKDAEKLIMDRFGKKSYQYYAQQQRIAGTEIKLGYFKPAEEKLLTALDELKKLRGKDSKEYLSTIQTLTRLYVTTGDYEQADKQLASTTKILKNASSGSLLGYNGLEEEALLLLNKALYSDAEKRAYNLLVYRQFKFGKDVHRSLIIPQLILSDVFLAKGDYVKSLDAVNQAVSMSRAIFNDSSLYYLKSKSQLSKVLSALGDYENAEDHAEEALTNAEKYYGASYFENGVFLLNLAMVKFYLDPTNKQVATLINKAIELNQKNFGSDHPQYAQSLMYLSAYFTANRRYAESENLLDRADEIYSAKLGAKNVYKASILAQKADIRRAQRKWEEAVKLYDQSAKLYQVIFGVSHPMYVSVYGKSGQVLYALGNLKKAAEIAEFTTNQNLNFIQKFFPSMSEREKAKYWSVIKPDFEYYYTIALRFKDKRPKIIGKLYDISLATKAILLSSSVKTRQSILNSDNMELRNNYRNWLKRKEDLAAALEMTKSQQDALGINIKKLEEELNGIEKKLYEKSKEFREENEERYTSWPEIRKSLGANEMAVEIVRFRYFEENFTDSVVYAAFVIKPTSKNSPEMVIWPMGKKLEEKYVNYYKNSMRFMMEDELSYQIFWQPLAKTIPPGTKVYFSPDGVFNQMNVETFKAPSGRHVIDEQDIYVLSNTKDILKLKDIEARKRIVKNEAVLVGDPTFYDPAALNRIPKGSKLSELPGTSEEVASLDKILKISRWETTTLLKTAADETYIKTIRSPKVLHIATHGFFLEDLKIDTIEAGNLIQNRAVDNPLLRSGLVLNDGGELLLENDYRMINQREGVLTAYEAMSLNLDQTDMVVLSACETGLGEIMVGEGVYGLQRAFQIAGAKVVVMSLFKVSDNVTRELMQIFYEKWLVQNYDKRVAFLESKKEIRKRHPKEKHWGSFVMVGAE